MAETRRVGVQVGGDASGFNSAIMGAQSKLSGFKKAALGITGAVGVATAAMGVKSVQAAGDFQQAMTESTAIMGDVSDKMRNDMAAAAREVGAETQFSSEQAAESYFYLASAGLDAADSMQVLGEMAKFAQAGQFDMAQATDIVTDANSALKRDIGEMSGLMDVLVRSNELANASVEQFGEALTTKAGNAMSRFNVDLEQGMAVLAQFATTGLKGRRAGTIFSRTLTQLATKARENQAAFEKLGVRVFDSQGGMRDMTDIISDLEGQLEGMTTAEKEAALASLNLNERAMDGIDRLLGSSDAMKEWVAQLKDAEGATDRVASKQMKSFNAQAGLLTDNFNNMKVAIGNKFLPSLTDTIQHGLIPFVKNLTNIITESDSFLEFMDKASKQWLPGLRSEFRAVWKAGGGNFADMIRAIGERYAPRFQGAINAAAGAVEMLQNWFGQVDWQGLKEQGIEAASGIGQEFADLAKVVTGALDFSGLDTEAPLDLDFDISTGLKEALVESFGVKPTKAGATAAGIRSAVFGALWYGTGSFTLAAIGASIGVNLIATPTVKFAKTIHDAVTSSDPYKNLKDIDFGPLDFIIDPIIEYARKIDKAITESDEYTSLDEMDFGPLDFIIKPLVGFARSIRAAVKSSNPWKDMQDGEISFGALDMVINPMVGFARSIKKATKSSQPWKDMQDGKISFGALDVVINPMIGFARQIDAAVKSSQPWVDMRKGKISFGALDVVIKPVIGYALKLTKAIKSSDPWTSLKDINFGPLDVVIDPSIDFIESLVTAAKSSDPWTTLKEGVDFGSLGIAVDGAINFAQELAAVVKGKQTWKDLKEGVDFGSLDVLADPAIDFVQGLTDVITSKQPWKDLKSDGIDFGALDVLVDPLVDFVENLEKAVKSKQPWKDMQSGGISFGALDIAIEPAIGFVRSLKQAIKSKQPWKDLQSGEISFGDLDVAVKPIAGFVLSLEEAIRSKQPWKDLQSGEISFGNLDIAIRPVAGFIRSLKAAVRSTQPWKDLKSGEISFGPLDVAIRPTASLAWGIAGAVKQDTTWAEAKADGVDFGDIDVVARPVVDFIHSIREAVRSTTPWKDLQKREISFGALDVAIKPSIGFALSLQKAIRSTQPWKDLQSGEISFGDLDVAVKPIAGFVLSLKKAVKSTQPWKDLKSGEISFGSLDVAIQPAASLAWGIAEAVKQDTTWAETKADGVDFGEVDIVARPVIDFIHNIRAAVRSTTPWKDMQKGEISFGDLDIAIVPSIGFAKSLKKAIKSTQPWKDLESGEISFGKLDIVVQPSVSFSTSLKKNVKKSGPVSGLLETGVEYPIPVTLGISALTWGTVKAGGAIAATGKSLATLVTGMISLPATIALGTVAGALALDKIDKTIEEDYADFSAWLDAEFNTEVPDPWEKTVNAAWDVVTQLTPSQIFGDLADAWNKWMQDPPWSNIDWGDTFNRPDWTKIDFGQIKDVVWDDVVNWPGWEHFLGWPGWGWLHEDIQAFGEKAGQAWSTYVNWPGWDAVLEWEGWDWLTKQIGKIPWPDVNLPPWLQTLVDIAQKGWEAVMPQQAKAPSQLQKEAREVVNPTKGGGVWGGDKPLIDPGEIQLLQKVFEAQNATTEEKVAVINSLLDKAAETVEQGKAEQSDLTASVIELQNAIEAWHSSMWQLPWNENDGHQRGTPWTGSGPRDEVAGFVHNQEAVVPQSVLRGGAGPVLDFLGLGSRGGGATLALDNANTAAKLDAIRDNTNQMAEKLNAVAGGEGGNIQVDINGVTSLDQVLEAITREWNDQRRAVGK